MKLKIYTVLIMTAALLAIACGKSDADLTKAANDKLAADKIAGVTASVKDGVGTLSGEVADITVKTKAEASVKGVEGIKSVNNQLTLPPPKPAATPAGDDKMLEGTVNENLKKAGLTTVTATVADGSVTLTGTVATKEDFAKAQMAATSTNPKHVDNKVEVKK